MNVEYRKLIAWLLSVALFLGCFGTGEVRAEDNGNSVSGVKYIVSITGLDAPEIGSQVTTSETITVEIATSCAIQATGSAISSDLYETSLAWYSKSNEDYNEMSDGAKFDYDTVYKAELTISPKKDENLFKDFVSGDGNQVKLNGLLIMKDTQPKVNIEKVGIDMVIDIEYSAIANATESPTITPTTAPTVTPSTAPTAHPTVQPSAPTLTCGSTVDAIQVVKQNSTVNLSVTAMLSDSNKEQYTYSYEWKWAGEKQSSKNNTCVVKPRKKGVYEWTCTVAAMNSNQTQKASDTISGVICVCQSSGGEVVLTKSLKAQNLCKTVFGVKSGDTQSGVKVTVTKLTAKGKKEKKCWRITKSKITAKKYLAKGTVKMQMKFQYRGKFLTKTIQVKLRTGIPAGKVTFTLKNGGKKITCKYSKEIVNIVKNHKKYGIKDVDVAIRYSMNGRSYKPVPSLVKGYFNVKRLNKKCFITTAGKYRIKKFKVTLRYKVTGKTQKKNMKVINRLAK